MLWSWGEHELLKELKTGQGNWMVWAIPSQFSGHLPDCLSPFTWGCSSNRSLKTAKPLPSLQPNAWAALSVWDTLLPKLCKADFFFFYFEIVASRRGFFWPPDPSWRPLPSHSLLRSCVISFMAPMTSWNFLSLLIYCLSSLLVYKLYLQEQGCCLFSLPQ